MIASLGGPYDVGGQPDLLVCFDTTASTLFAWISTLVDGNHELAAAVLADTYLDVQRTALASGSAPVHGIELAVAAYAATVARGAAGSGVHPDQVTERALFTLGVRDGCPTEDIATILGVPAEDAARVLASVRARADVVVGLGVDGWLDDSTRNRARSAVMTGRRIERPDQPGPSQIVVPTSGVMSEWAGSDRPERDRAGSGASEQRRPRRLVAFAATGVAALLVAAVIWLSPSGSDRSNGPDGTELALGQRDSTATTDATPATTDGPTSTVRPATTVETSTAEPRFQGPELTLSPGYILTDVPAGLQPTALYESPADDSSQQLQGLDGWFQLWTSPGATRSTGRWMAMATGQQSPLFAFAQSDRVRIAGDGFRGTKTVSSDGVLQLDLIVQVSGDDVTVSMVSFGIPETDLISVAMSLSHFDAPNEGDSTSIESATFQPVGPGLGVLQGLEMVESGAAGCCGVYGVQQPAPASRQINYGVLAPGPATSNVWIDTRNGTARTEYSRFAEPRSPDPDAPQNSDSTEQIGARVVHVSGSDASGLPDQPAYTSVWWVEGGRTISITAQMSVSQMVALVPSVRLATEDEWLQLNEDVFISAPERPAYHDPMTGPTVSLGSVTLAEGSVSARIDGAATALELGFATGQMSSFGGAYGWHVDPEHPVTQYDTVDSTVLVIAVPGAEPGSQVRVTVEGRDPRDVPLVPIGESGVSAALDAFNELPIYTVELLDPAGNVVRLLTT